MSENPSSTEHSQREEKHPLKLALPNSENKPTLLVVEDSEPDRMMLVGLLQRYCKVSQVSDGLKALESFIEHKPDIVLLDINLPKINGIKVLQEMRRVYPNTYIIMISGDSTKDNIVESVEFGAKGFVKKPFSKSSLLVHLNKYNKELSADCPTLS